MQQLRESRQSAEDSLKAAKMMAANSSTLYADDDVRSSASITTSPSVPPIKQNFCSATCLLCCSRAIRPHLRAVIEFLGALLQHRAHTTA